MIKLLTKGVIMFKVLIALISIGILFSMDPNTYWINWLIAVSCMGILFAMDTDTYTIQYTDANTKEVIHTETKRIRPGNPFVNVNRIIIDKKVYDINKVYYDVDAETIIVFLVKED